ncbi:hypothetical protein F4775DRAFT_580654 [Biscogniauxia sp. FL1348]|nr:hypothetical protein F4775DRAFT_580654 [Biscogniauxia sp. FL1348]
MCRFNYKGFGCGHIDPEGTPVEHQLCGPPARRPHEPMCDPPESYRLYLNGIHHCPECKSILDWLQAAWAAKRREWRANHALPETHINRVNRELIASRAMIGIRGVRRGPYHTENQRYEPEQQVIIEAAERLAESFRRLDEAWEDNMSILRGFNTISSERLDGYNRRREVARNSASTIDDLERYEGRLLDDMYKIHNRRMGLGS